jgi:hypothetical protein
LSNAVIGLLGVIVGAIVAGAVALLGEQFTTRREREARQAIREQERKDSHDVFQREAIIALHDAVRDYWGVAIEAHEQILKAIHASRDLQQLDPRVFLSPLRPAYWRMTGARAKVFDDELRRLVEEFSLQLDVAIPEIGREGEEGAWAACHQLFRQIAERVNFLLKQLYLI